MNKEEEFLEKQLCDFEDESGDYYSGATVIYLLKQYAQQRERKARFCQSCGTPLSGDCSTCEFDKLIKSSRDE